MKRYTIEQRVGIVKFTKKQVISFVKIHFVLDLNIEDVHPFDDIISETRVPSLIL